MRVVVDAGREAVERDPCESGLRLRLAIGLGELFADGVEVEQVTRRLRNEADERARLRRGKVPGIAAADVDPPALPSAAAL